MKDFSKAISPEQLADLRNNIKAHTAGKNVSLDLTSLFADTPNSEFLPMPGCVNYQFPDSDDPYKVFYAQYLNKNDLVSLNVCTDRFKPQTHIINACFDNTKDGTKNDAELDKLLLDLINWVLWSTFWRVQESIIEYTIAISPDKNKDWDHIFQEIKSECDSDPLSKVIDNHNRSFTCFVSREVDISTIYKLEEKAKEYGIMLNVEELDDENLFDHDVGVFMRTDHTGNLTCEKSRGVTVVINPIYKLDLSNDRVYMDFGIYVPEREENPMNEPYGIDRAIKITRLNDLK